MGKLSQKVGSEFETEAERMFRKVEGAHFVINWNDRQIPKLLKPADIQTCIGGLSVLCECKTTKAQSLGFQVIGDINYYDEDKGERKGENNQRRTLMLHAMSGGLSLLAIKKRYANKSRFYLTSYQHWEALRRSLWDERKSCPLVDNNRPASLKEVGRLYFQEVSSIFNKGDTELRDLILGIHAEAQTMPIWDYRFDKWFAG